MNRPAVRSFEGMYAPLTGGTLTRLAGHERLCMLIAPHPDDDVIGAGGTMALIGRARGAVVTVYVTSGAPAAGRGRSGIAQLRRREALGALRFVKACGAFFLPFTSQDVQSEPAAVESTLMSLIRMLGPRELYLPCPFERHATHRAVTNLAVKGLRRLPTFTGELWGYSVWSTLPPSALVRNIDISRVAGLKRLAIEQHKSQLAGKDYADGVLGLNRYAGVFNSIGPDKKRIRYAEQFLDMRRLVMKPALNMDRFVRLACAPDSAASDDEPRR